MKVIILPEAHADLRAIRERRAEWTEQSAEELAQALLARIRQIRDFPESGRIVPEFQVQYLRELLEQGHRIMYELFPDKLEVFGVFHSRQDIRPSSP